jgi:acetoacetate decarboxylase
MDAHDVLAGAFAMPRTSPSYPVCPYRYVAREFLTIAYATDPDAVAAQLPEPLAMTDAQALALAPHALAPVADLPVLGVVSATHLVADLTLGLGEVVHDYLAPT